MGLSAAALRLHAVPRYFVRKRSKGFARRFRPTLPGFPVEVGGVEHLHTAFFKRKPHARSSLMLRDRKSGQRWCEHGAPLQSCVGAMVRGGESYGAGAAGALWLTGRVFHCLRIESSASAGVATTCIRAWLCDLRKP